MALGRSLCGFASTAITNGHEHGGDLGVGHRRDQRIQADGTRAQRRGRRLRRPLAVAHGLAGCE